MAMRRRHGTRTRIESPLLSVVMPVYNERATIDEIIERDQPGVFGIVLGLFNWLVRAFSGED